MSMIFIKHNLPHSTTVGVKIQVLRLNRFRLTHEIQLNTHLSTSLYGAVIQNEDPYIVQEYAEADAYEAQVDVNYQYDHQQTHSLHFQISQVSSIYFKGQFTNSGSEGIYNPIKYIQNSNWEQYSLHIGYEYKNFAIEYKSKSNYREPQIRIMYKMEFPWRYFQDMASTQVAVEEKVLPVSNETCEPISPSNMDVMEEFTVPNQTVSPTRIQLEDLNQLVWNPPEEETEEFECMTASASCENQEMSSPPESLRMEAAAINTVAEDSFVLLVPQPTEGRGVDVLFAFVLGVGIGLSFNSRVQRVYTWCKQTLVKWFSGK